MVMSSDSSAGSYDFAALGVESGELERLQLQARRSAELELQLLRRMGLKDGLDVLDLGTLLVYARRLTRASCASRVCADTRKLSFLAMPGSEVRTSSNASEDTAF